MKNIRFTESIEEFEVTACFSSLAESFFDSFTKPVFTLKDTGFTQRAISYWDAQGLLFSDKPIEGKWRRFSFLEYIWLKIIDEYRSVGVPVKLLQELKEGLFKQYSVLSFLKGIINKPGWDEKIKFKSDFDKDFFTALMTSEIYEHLTNREKLPFIFFAIQEIITEHKYIFITLFKDGKWVLHDGVKTFKLNGELDEDIVNNALYITHITISLSNIIKDFLVDASILKIQGLPILTENEVTILDAIKSGEYESISIEFKEKKPHILNLEKSEYVQKRIVDILSEGKYQTITIQQRKGKLVRILNNKKILLE